MKLKHPFFKLSPREQKIHAVIWVFILIAINIPEWAVALGPFHSDDYSLIIPSLYGIILKMYLFYGTAFKIAENNQRSIEKRLALTIRLFVVITLIESVLDSGYYTIHHWNMNVTMFTEIIMGQSLLNFIFFYLPSLMFGFTRAIYKQESTINDVPTLEIEDKGKKVTFVIKELTHVESIGDHCIFHAGSKITIHQSLESVQEILPDNFVRCHKRFIINTEHVQKQLGNELLIGGFIIPLEKEYQDGVTKKSKPEQDYFR